MGPRRKRRKIITATHTTIIRIPTLIHTSTTMVTGMLTSLIITTKEQWL